MSKTPQAVLIGDEDPDRAQWLAGFLNEYYGLTGRIVEALEDALSLAGRSDWPLIFLTDNLPYMAVEVPTTQANFEQLRQKIAATRKYNYAMVCVVTRDSDPDWTAAGIAPPFHIHLSSPPTTSAGVKALVDELRSLGSILPLIRSTEDLAGKVRWDRSNRQLRAQISALSLDGLLKEGEDQLYSLISNSINCQEADRIQIKQLGQGKSGAQVFHLIVSHRANKSSKSADDHYILKLSETGDLWKLRAEVKGYQDAHKSTNFSDYERHIPRLQKAHFPRYKKDSTHPEHWHIASSWRWDAIHYDFLGANILSDCMALETALISEPSKLRERAARAGNPTYIIASLDQKSVLEFRLKFLEHVLDGLCRIWYLNKELVERKSRTLWQAKDRLEREYASFPAYCFKKRTRQWVQSFLDSNDAEIGKRLSEGGMVPTPAGSLSWDVCCSKVLNLVSERKENGLGVLKQKQAVILSPVHGDLNASNVFLWLRTEKFPFLIDLPFYQEKGHALQDFARLEVEFKFALMDRQEESPTDQLPAFDQTPAQAALWREMENHLLNHPTDLGARTAWQSAGFLQNVELTYQLVQKVRQKAKEVQQQKIFGGGPAEEFESEYFPALLYHTVLAIGYPSLSIFKRCLAVYSAGSIMNKLGL
jgi:hypothetical protein